MNNKNLPNPNCIKTLLAVLMLAVSIFWHAETGKYQILVTGGDILDPISHRVRYDARFVEFNTRSGRVERYCYLDSGHCLEWEKFQKHAEKEDAAETKKIFEGVPK